MADLEGDLLYRYLHFVKKWLEYKESILTVHVSWEIVSIVGMWQANAKHSLWVLKLSYWINLIRSSKA